MIITQNKEWLNSCFILQIVVKCQQSMSEKKTQLNFCIRDKVPVQFETEETGMYESGLQVQVQKLVSDLQLKLDKIPDLGWSRICC